MSSYSTELRKQKSLCSHADEPSSNITTRPMRCSPSCHAAGAHTMRQGMLMQLLLTASMLLQPAAAQASAAGAPGLAQWCALPPVNIEAKGHSQTLNCRSGGQLLTPTNCSTVDQWWTRKSVCAIPTGLGYPAANWPHQVAAAPAPCAAQTAATSAAPVTDPAVCWAQDDPVVLGIVCWFVAPWLPHDLPMDFLHHDFVAIQ